MLTKASLLQTDKLPSPPVGQTASTQWRFCCVPPTCRCLIPALPALVPGWQRLQRLELVAQDFSAPSWLGTLPSYGVTLKCKPWQPRRLSWATLPRTSSTAQRDSRSLDSYPLMRISSGHAVLPPESWSYPFRRQN